MTRGGPDLYISDTMVAVLRILKQCDRPLRHTDIAERAGSPVYSTYMALTTLHERGWVTKDRQDPAENGASLRNRPMVYALTRIGDTAATWILDKEDNPE